MLKRILTPGIVLTILLGTGVLCANAQDASKAKSEAAQVGHAYRLDFTLNELEDGKRINSRQYSLNLNGGDHSDVKIGSRVPVETNHAGEYQYLDVGTSIWCRTRDYRDVSWLGDDLLLDVQADVSNFAGGDQPRQAPGPMPGPLIRQMKINANAIVTVGKQISLATVDDPNSKRQFQMEVLVTKLR
ncbi:MAG TPA: hypothetical protein VGG04_08220 [Candidatus Sulfotelmatobacter sp.]|jgi:hypothetical protein